MVGEDFTVACWEGHCDKEQKTGGVGSQHVTMVLCSSKLEVCGIGEEEHLKVPGRRQDVWQDVGSQEGQDGEL